MEGDSKNKREASSMPSKKMSRREMLYLTGAGGIGLLLGASGLGSLAAGGHSANTAQKVAAVDTKEIVPFYGKHQAGIITKPQNFVCLTALDVRSEKLAKVRELFKAWTLASEKMTHGQLVGDYRENPYVPPADTGEAEGLSPSKLTITFGFGPSFFVKAGEDRFGLAGKKPAVLRDLPEFAGDELDPAWVGGDIGIQICSDDQQIAFHAIRNLVRMGRGIVALRWTQSGFQRSHRSDPSQGTPRNLLGFKDGTVNPDSTREMNNIVWSDGSEANWMRNGSYMVARRIRMFIEVWDRTHMSEQELTFGRKKRSGAPLGQTEEFDEVNLEQKDAQGKPLIPPDSHIALARSGGAEKILRRSYSYAGEIDPARAQLDAGLIFISYQKNPLKQFVPIQQRMASADRLNEYIRHIGSAVFACPGGIEKGGYIGNLLF